jgi:NADH dehydrogenase
MPKLAITGATGFVGRALVQQARAEGYAVRAVVRQPRRAQALAEAWGCELFHGNVLYGPALAGAFAGVQCVIHLVGIIQERQENTFDRAHRQATENVIAEARAAGVKRLIHMSALGSRPQARSRYHQTKWAAEEAVRKSGLAWTIFRPSLIYGSGNQSLAVLARLARWLPVVPVLGDGESKIQPVAVDVVARAFLAAVRLEVSVGKTYDLCGPTALTWNQLYDLLLAAQGLRKPKLHMAWPLARALAAVLETVWPAGPLTRDQLIMLQEDNVGDPRPAEQDLLLEQEDLARALARGLYK